MAAVSWNEASKCFKCGESGIEVGSHTGPMKGSTVKTLRCDNERCRGYDDMPQFRWSWIVQVNQDGTIPVREARGPKQFQLDRNVESISKRVVENLERTSDDAISSSGDAKEIRR